MCVKFYKLPKTIKKQLMSLKQKVDILDSKKGINKTTSKMLPLIFRTWFKHASIFLRQTEEKNNSCGFNNFHFLLLHFVLVFSLEVFLELTFSHFILLFNILFYVYISVYVYRHRYACWCVWVLVFYLNCLLVANIIPFTS